MSDKLDANDVACEIGSSGLTRELGRMLEEAESISTEPIVPKSSSSWPSPLKRDAFHGLTGEIVRTIEPHTEADPAAMLVCFLVAFGNCIGRKAHFAVGAVKHHANLFAVIVGKTSTARKGTAWYEIIRFFEVQEDWRARVAHGLSTGEGLIEAVRDGDGDDPGEGDKRLLAFEAEFSKLLKQGERKGNTLSEVCRGLWESGTAQSMTRQNPLKATGAHVSILGNITETELKKLLNETECANGFGNRFLWACAKRSQVLPMPGSPTHDDIASRSWSLNDAITFAQKADAVTFSSEAQDMWGRKPDDDSCLYAKLTKGGDGLAAYLCARAAPIVLRLATIYALLDKKIIIEPIHLRAALAVWEYAEASVRYIFGDALGDATADKILRELRQLPDGMSRNDIYNLFKHNKSIAEIERALELLEQNGLAGKEKRPTAGRPIEFWLAISQ